MSKLLCTLKRRNFWPLFATQGLGALNDNIFRTALVTYIIFQIPVTDIPQETKSILSTLALGLMMLPFFLFSSLAGELADRLRKSSLVKIIKFSELVVIILGALGFIWGNPYFLLGIIFLMGAQSAFFGPVKYSLLPEILPDDELIGGNGLFEAATFVAIVLGCLLGGALASIMPYRDLPLGNYLVAGTVMIVAGLGFWSACQLPPSKMGDQAIKPNPRIWQSTYQIIRQAWAHETIWLCILGLSWFWLLGGMFISQLPNFVDQILGGQTSIYNLLLAIFSVGVGLGSVGCQWLLKGRISPKYVPWAALLMAALLIDLAFLILAWPPAANLTPGLANLSDPQAAAGAAKLSAGEFLATFKGWHLTINLFLISFAGGFYVVPLNTMLQHLSPPEECSRMIAANNIVNSFFMALSSVLAAVFLWLGGHVSAIFAVLAAGGVLVAIMTIFLLPEHVVRAICAALLKVIYRVEIKGQEHVNNLKGPALLAANHTSLLDAVLFVAFVPRKLTFAINTQWAGKWWLKPLLKMFKALPLDPLNPMATRSLIEELERGGLVVIFPEGRMSTTGGLMKIYDGPALVADKAKAPIVPAAIGGAQYSLFARYGPQLKRRPHKGITLYFGKPINLDLPPHLSGRQRRREAGEELYRLISQTQFEAAPTNVDIWASLIKMARIQGWRRPILADVTKQTLTYGQLITRSRILGRYLTKFTDPGEIVGVMLPNVNAAVVCFLGLNAAGRVPAMLNFSQGAGPMAAAIKAAGLRKVFTSRKFLEASSLVQAVETLPAQVLCLEDFKLTFWDKLAGLLYRPGARNPDQPAEVLFTSGSEGLPKGVALSHRNVMSNIHQLLSRVNFNELDVLLNALPMFHSFGLNVGVLLPLLTGAKTVLYPSPLHRRVIPELAYDAGATILVATDTFLRAWGTAAHPYDFYNIRYIFSGAEKVRPETRELYFEKFGLRIYEGYGVTEASPVLALNTAMHYKKGTVGQLLPGIVSRLEPLDGLDETSAEGKSMGRLMVKGPNVMLGYLKAGQPGRVQPAAGGWYDTGDVVSIDSEGYLSIIGRQKRFAKIAGEMLSLEALERVAQNLWPGQPTAVINRPDPRRGERLILVTANKGAQLNEYWAALKAAGFTELAWPREIRIGEVPLTPLGKVNYPKLEEALAAEGEPSSASRPEGNA